MQKSSISKYMPSDAFIRAFVQKGLSLSISVKMYIINVCIMMRIFHLLSGADFKQLILGICTVKMVVDSVSVYKKGAEKLNEQD